MPSDVINRAGTAAAFAARLADLRGSLAYRNYELVRSRVFEMRTLEAQLPHYQPSAYWTEELTNFEYLLDASPLVIDKLRHHSFHITGLRVYDYRSNRDRWRERFIEKRRALLKHGKRELLVPEWRPLGGFGFEIEEDLYNIDTLKFFEVLIALDKGSVLGEFRGNADRRLVWEIGAGWGGFPYQFKTLCPNVTYVITDFPELFLFSATYLMTAFPDAKVAFWGQEPFAETLANWRQYDFIFAPNTAVAEFTPERLDLAVNMVSFQEMTEAQVTDYVRRAHALNCPFLYSLNRERSSYNRELESVSAIIDRYFWPHEIPVLSVPYTRMMDERPQPHDYKHVIGWRRVQV
jgi:hypothetical protein